MYVLIFFVRNKANKRFCNAYNDQYYAMNCIHLFVIILPIWEVETFYDFVPILEFLFPEW